MKKGISLIVLVITIIVIIILASAVIISLSNNNPIAQATEAVFKSNVNSYQAELIIAISNEYLNDYSFNPNTFNKGVWTGGDIEGTIKQYIPSISADDGLKFEIQNGRLVYVGADATEQNWFINMGMTTADASEPFGVGIIATQNRTINGGQPSYNNPIIPKGFMAVNDQAVWPGGWNNGLVIEDENGNQFVWIPVDGTNVPYQKWCTTNLSHTYTSDDTLPAGIDENTQIATYGGFYISRYEAGNESNILVSKKNVQVWANINYTNSKIKAESMYNTAEIKSGLLTGTQWDTAMKWIDNSGKSVTDSRTWGNHSDSTNPANVSGFGDRQVTGFSENWKANNIYDIAGNTWSWTNEKYETNYIFRGASCYNSGIDLPVSYRGYGAATYEEYSISFRVVLYIL